MINITHVPVYVVPVHVLSQTSLRASRIPNILYQFQAQKATRTRSIHLWIHPSPTRSGFTLLPSLPTSGLPATGRQVPNEFYDPHGRFCYGDPALTYSPSLRSILVLLLAHLPASAKLKRPILALASRQNITSKRPQTAQARTLRKISRWPRNSESRKASLIPSHAFRLVQ